MPGGGESCACSVRHPTPNANWRCKFRAPTLPVSPPKLGSSVGVSKARNAEEFKTSCAHALQFDKKILIEQSVPSVREIECSVLEDENGDVRTSELGEIVPGGGHDFYSYDAKYIDADGAALVVPAQLSPKLKGEIQELAAKTFKTLCCEGMARIDFFLSGDDVFVNEANTLPGFTNISMYPKLWEASGLPQTELMNVLIGHALARHKASRSLTSRRD